MLFSKSTRRWRPSLVSPNVVARASAAVFFLGGALVSLGGALAVPFFVLCYSFARQRTSAAAYGISALFVFLFALGRAPAPSLDRFKFSAVVHALVFHPFAYPSR